MSVHERIRQLHDDLQFERTGHPRASFYELLDALPEIADAFEVAAKSASQPVSRCNCAYCNLGRALARLETKLGDT